MAPRARRRSAATRPDAVESGTDTDGNTPPVETLVAGRARRATAGNRLSTLLDRGADDELELLFAEDEEDVEFETKDAEDEADVRFDSSDEDEADEEQPGVGGEEDLAGERELQQQARTERQAKKRKAHESLFKPPALRKRVKVDPTMVSGESTTPASKPRKRSERTTWMPPPTGTSLRASSRKATVQNKEDVHARMKEHEKRRLQQIASMDNAAKRKAKVQAKTLTQNDRLIEARKTERLNSKSLNRWEATEKKRAAEEKARLAALHNRKLEGPVITWWSGLAEWSDEGLKHVGRKAKADEVKDGHENRGNQEQTSAVQVVDDHDDPSETQQIGGGNDVTTSIPAVPSTSVAPDVSLSNEEEQHNDVPRDEVSPPSPPSLPMNPDRESPTSIDLPLRPSSANVHKSMSLPPPPPSQPLHPGSEYSTRNLVILENFDSTSIKDRDFQRRILFKRRIIKPQS